MEERVAPLYYPGFDPPQSGVGTSLPRLDAIQLLYQIFGDFSETRRDGGIKVGFISSYSEQTLGENFAEHFAFYVYQGTQFRAKMDRQERDFGSNLLTRKYLYILRIFFDLWFEDQGKVGGWLGYRF